MLYENIMKTIFGEAFYTCFYPFEGFLILVQSNEKCRAQVCFLLGPTNLDPNYLDRIRWQRAMGVGFTIWEPNQNVVALLSHLNGVVYGIIHAGCVIQKQASWQGSVASSEARTMASSVCNYQSLLLPKNVKLSSSSSLNLSSVPNISLQFLPTKKCPFLSSTPRALTVISMAPPKPGGKSKKGKSDSFEFLPLFGSWEITEKRKTTRLSLLLLQWLEWLSWLWRRGRPLRHRPSGQRWVPRVWISWLSVRITMLGPPTRLAMLFLLKLRSTMWVSRFLVFRPRKFG